MIVAVTGGRDHEPTRPDRAQFRAFIEIFGYWLRGGEHLELRVGDCPTGVDAWALEWAHETQTAVTVYCADPRRTEALLLRLPADRVILASDWNRDGLAAGPIRNRAMLKGSGCPADVLVAFPGGSGTADCVRAAEWLSVPVWRVDLGQHRWHTGPPPVPGTYATWDGLWASRTRWDGSRWCSSGFLARRGYPEPLRPVVCWRE